MTDSKFGVAADEDLKQRLKNASFKKSYQKFRDEDAALVAVIKARQKAGLSQQQLADKAGVPQSTVARFERGANTSLKTFNKLVNALGGKIKISF